MKAHRRTLKPGDIVQLNGQGPRMTVIKYISEPDFTGHEVHSNNIVRCHWYDNDGEQTADFHQHHLVRLDAPARDAVRIKVGHDRLIDPNEPTPGQT